MASLSTTKAQLERLLAARGWSQTLSAAPAVNSAPVITVLQAAGGQVTSLALEKMAEALAPPAAVAAWVDGADALDPPSAAAMGLALDRLLWLRAGSATLPDLLAITQMLIATARFRLIALDLLSRPSIELGRLAQATWFRLLRGLERHRRGQLLILAPGPLRMPPAIRRLEVRSE